MCEVCGAGDLRAPTSTARGSWGLTMGTQPGCRPGRLHRGETSAAAVLRDVERRETRRGVKHGGSVYAGFTSFQQRRGIEKVAGTQHQLLKAHAHALPDDSLYSYFPPPLPATPRTPCREVGAESGWGVRNQAGTGLKCYEYVARGSAHRLCPVAH